VVNDWRIVFTHQARTDAKKLGRSGRRESAEKLLDILCRDPFETPPPFEKLRGDLPGAYSRRIDIQHGHVYEVVEDARTVKVIRMSTHYE
jgi:toxin YoeB